MNLPELKRLAEAAKRLTPVTINNTPDYAEVTFGDAQIQAMTLEPETVLALNALPALISRIEEMEGALEPFAAMAMAGDQTPKDDAVWAGQDGKRITYGDFRRAALAKAGGSQ